MINEALDFIKSYFFFKKSRVCKGDYTPDPL